MVRAPGLRESKRKLRREKGGGAVSSSSSFIFRPSTRISAGLEYQRPPYPSGRGPPPIRTPVPMRAVQPPPSRLLRLLRPPLLLGIHLRRLLQPPSCGTQIRHRLPALGGQGGMGKGRASPPGTPPFLVELFFGCCSAGIYYSPPVPLAQSPALHAFLAVNLL